MGDRRIADRREREKGIIRLRLRDAIIYVVVAIILIIQLFLNIILFIKNQKYKEEINYYENEYYTTDEVEEDYNNFDYDSSDENDILE